MKQKETMSNSRLNEDSSVRDLPIDEMDNKPISKGIETSMRADAFDVTNEEKIAKIESCFKEIMETLGLDLSDDSLNGTPKRVAKMYINEVFSGLDPGNKPVVKLFDNKYQYNQMLVEKDITFYSNCEHHFVPFFGKAHLAYISNGAVIGLSKLNRIVNYFAKRPQVQERLTMQIAQELKEVLNTEDIAIVIEASHLCVSSRGIKDESSSTLTSFYSGKFKEEQAKKEFLSYLTTNNKYK